MFHTGREKSVGDNVPALVTYSSVMTTFCVCCRDGIAALVCGLSYEVNDSLRYGHSV